MAASGEGFVIPARVVVSLEGLNQVRSQLQSFVSAAQGAAKAGERPIDPTTGAQAGLRRMQEETGAALNAARKAASLIQTELGKDTLGKKRRQELEAELKTYQRLEQQILRTTAAARRDAGGKVQPPIYPADSWRYPTVAGTMKGARPIAPERPLGPGVGVDLPIVRRRPAEVPVELPAVRSGLRRGGVQAQEAEQEAARELTRAEKRLEQAVLKRAEIQDLLSASGMRTLREEAALAAEAAQLKSVEAQLRAGDIRLLKATADAANAREEEAHRVTLLRAGKDPGDLQGAELRAAAAVTKRTQADLDRAAIARQSAQRESGAIDAAARVRLEETKYRLAVRKRERELIEKSIRDRDPDIGRGTWFQQLQAKLSPASNKLPEEFYTGRQFLAQKFQTTVGFAASGAAIGFAATAIAEMFRDATQLEQTFVRLRGQMEGIGRVDAFPAVREEIRAIAAETGQLSNDVATFYSRMIGVSRDPSQAIADTSSAMKLATVTGLDMKTMMQSLVPIQKAFGLSAAQIGDEVVAMGEKFGIAEDDLVQFLGKTASVAKNAGLSFKELTIIGANVANSLGKPIDSSAEAINKAFGQIEANSQKIFTILQANPSTQGAIPQMIDALGAGETGKALTVLLRASQDFNAGQQNAILRNVVSRREAEEFNALIQNAGPILAQLEAAESNAADSSGKLESRFKDLKETVGLTFSSIRAAFEGIGEALFRSGLSDFLRDLGGVIKIVVGAIGGLVKAFAWLNESVRPAGALISLLLRMALVAGTVVKAYTLLAGLKGRSRDASEAENTSEAKNVSTKNALGASATQAAGAEAKLAGAKGASAAASQRAVGTVGGYPYAIQGARPPATPASIGAIPPAAAGGLPFRLAADRARAARQAIAAENLAARQTTRLAGQDRISAVIAGNADKRAADATTSATRATTQSTAATVLLNSNRRKISEALERERRSIRAAEYSESVRPAREAAAEAARASVRDRLRTSLREGTPGYQASRAQYAAQFAGQEGLKAGFGQRALAGGTLLRSGRADALTAATGAPKAMSTGWGLGLGLAAASAVMSAYEDQKAGVEGAMQAAQGRLDRMTAEQLKDMQVTRADIWTKLQMAFFRVPTPEELQEGEKTEAAAIPANILLGGPVRPEPKTDVQARVEEGQRSARERLNRDIASRLTDKSVLDIGKMLTETDLGKEIGEQTGVLAEMPKIGGHLATKDREAYGKLLNALAGRTDKEAQDIKIRIKAIVDNNGDMAALQAEADKLYATSDVAGKVKMEGPDKVFYTLGEYQGRKFESLELAMKRFEAGEISEAEFIQRQREALPILQKAGEEIGGQEGERFASLAVDTQKQMRDMQDKALKAFTDSANKIRTLGSSTPRTTTFQANVRTAEQMSWANRILQLPDMIQGQIDAAEEQWSMIADPIRRAQEKNKGIKLDPGVGQTWMMDLLNKDYSAQLGMDAMARASGKSDEQFQEQLTKFAADNNLTIREAAKQFIDSEIDRLEKWANSMEAAGGRPEFVTFLRNRVGAMRQNRDAFIASFANVPELPTGEADEKQSRANIIEAEARVRASTTKIEQAQAAGDPLKTAAIGARDAYKAWLETVEKRSLGKADDADVNDAWAAVIAGRRAEADALFDYQQLIRNRSVIAAEGDPVKENAAQMSIAQAELQRAQQLGDLTRIERANQQIMQLEQQARENRLNLQRARLQTELARVSEDPLAVARKQLEAAELELANAKGDIDREQKMGAVIQARLGLQNAISAGLSADAQLAIQLANLRGDTVGAATAAAEEAKRKLDEAVAKNITDRSVLAPLEGALAEANKQLYLAPIQKQISDLDYLYGLEQISLGDYIGLLEAQLSQMVYDSQEYRDLKLKIFNLKKGAQQDLGWSIPGNLTLPTLYEARRASATVFGTPSAPYQDNRNVQVDIAVNGAQDPVTVANQVAAALNESLRGGPTYSAGIPVGSGA